MKQIKGKLVVYGDHVYQIKSATMNNVVLHGLNKGAGEATFIRSIFDGKVSRGEISYIEKMYFDIDVTKVSRSTHTIRVEATNLEEAKDKAFKEACDTDIFKICRTTTDYMLKYKQQRPLKRNTCVKSKKGKYHCGCKAKYVAINPHTNRKRKLCEDCYELNQKETAEMSSR